jgi:hypothetical protein
MFHERCSFCRKVARGVAYACIFCGFVAGPIAAGNYELLHDVLDAIGSTPKKAKSTETSLTATATMQWTWHTTSSGGGGDGQRFFSVLEPGVNRFRSLRIVTDLSSGSTISKTRTDRT